MQKTVIIVAGGHGNRFDPDLPKQFHQIREKPLLMHTIDLFRRYDRDMKIIVGIRDDFTSYWKDLCKKYGFNIPHIITPAGETRYHTVKKALPEVAIGTLVAIHDAVRPLVYKRTIDACFKAAEKYGASIPCIEIHDSVREVSQEGSRRVSRDHYRLVQTPQVFKYDILIKGYEKALSGDYTDDASVVEEAGFPVTLVEGNQENIKITTREDLIYAEAIFESYQEKSGFF